MSFKRYVLQLEDGKFVGHVHWIASGGIPSSIVPDVLEKALIVSEDYLNFVDRRGKKSRKELLMENFPEIKLIPVEISLIDEKRSNQ